MFATSNHNQNQPGAIACGPNTYSFCVWAPQCKTVELHIVAPEDRLIPMQASANGSFWVKVSGVAPGARYLYRLDGEKERPDPASRSQPDGVHAASEVVDLSFPWTDQHWTGLSLHDYIIYELHIGTFTPEGTFDAAIAHLDRLHDLGITAIEVMPVAAFPGSRNWGYDGTHIFAVHTAYGGASALKRFVDACHQRGMAVVLDVVYNHLGPEGNYLWDYAGPPYFFTTRYQTPWGAAINFDGAYSDEVRRFFLHNVLQWIDEFHIDALRLDAVHAITDASAVPFLEELAGVVRRCAEQSGRRIYTIAESDQNDPRLLRLPTLGGYGLDAQWSDDFHHVVHTLLTGEKDGYYEDFGSFRQLARVFQQGWLYASDYSPHRKRRHGRPSGDISSGRLVVCTQNHDQVGNRMFGDRLSTLVSFDALKLAACTLVLSPTIPLLFMGEEYGEIAPFLYFVSHGDPSLVEAVRAGRKKEFAAFSWKGEPPDPQSETTFARSRLDHTLRSQGKHRVLESLYRELLHLRKTLPALATRDRERMRVTSFEPERVLMLHRTATPVPCLAAAAHTEGQEVVLLLCYHTMHQTVRLPLPGGRWRLLLNTHDQRWQDPDAPPTTSAVPDYLEVQDNEPVVTLAPLSCTLFYREERECKT